MELGCRAVPSSTSAADGSKKTARIRSRSTGPRILQIASDEGGIADTSSPGRNQSPSGYLSIQTSSTECHTPLRSKPPRSTTHKPPAIAALYSPMLPSSEPVGEGLAVPDKDLIELLRQRPKQVPLLRSRDSFRKYFRGIGKSRMESLLNAAYSTLEPADREDKVSKRLALLEGVMT